MLTALTWQELIKNTLETICRISDTKGIEYRHDNDDRLDNFKRVAQATGTTPEQCLHVYLSKHMDAISNFIRRGANPSKQLSEPIEGRIDDAIVYLLLLKGMVLEKRKEVAEPAYKKGDVVSHNDELLVCTDPPSKLPPPTGKDWVPYEA